MVFPSFQSNTQSTAETPTRPSNRAAGAAKLAHTALVPHSNEAPHRSSSSVAKERDSLTAPGKTRGTAPAAGTAGTFDLPLVRRTLEGQGLSRQSADIIMSAWRQNTRKQYKPYLRKWQDYCGQRKTDPLHPPVSEVINFLTMLYNTGIGYSAINTAKSAIASLVKPPEGHRTLGQHPLMIRYMKGIFEQRPSLPRYCATWDVKQVLDWLQRQDLQTLTLKELTHKTAMLLCLLSGQRLQTLIAIECQNMVLTADRCTFFIQKVSKTTKPGRHIGPLTFRTYDIANLCIVTHLQRYMDMTRPLRIANSSQLLISYRKPHGPVSTDTVSGWIKQGLKAANIDTQVFAAHSTRGAATYAAARQGAPLDIILRAANWRTATTFAKFYNRDILTGQDQGTAFADAVLKTTDCQRPQTMGD